MFCKTLSTSTFIGLLDKISNTITIKNEFYAFINKAISLGIIERTEVAIDSNKINYCEKRQPKKKLKNDDSLITEESKMIQMLIRLNGLVANCISYVIEKVSYH